MIRKKRSHLSGTARGGGERSRGAGSAEGLDRRPGLDPPEATEPRGFEPKATEHRRRPRANPPLTSCVQVQERGAGITTSNRVNP